MKYTVTATIQSPGNDPVEMRWATKTDAIGAMVSLGQLLDEEANPPRDGYSTTLLAVTIVSVPETQPPWSENV